MQILVKKFHSFIYELLYRNKKKEIINREK